MVVVMLFSMVNLKERTQNTVLHTVNTAVLGSCGGGAIFYGRGDLQRGYPYRKRDSGCHAADHAEPYQHCNRPSPVNDPGFGSDRCHGPRQDCGKRES